MEILLTGTPPRVLLSGPLVLSKLTPLGQAQQHLLKMLSVANMGPVLLRTRWPALANVEATILFGMVNMLSFLERVSSVATSELSSLLVLIITALRSTFETTSPSTGNAASDVGANGKHLATIVLPPDTLCSRVVPLCKQLALSL